MNQKSVAITGAQGQTGSYLVELYLEKGYRVYGMMRRSSTFSTERIEHVYNHPNLKLIYGDLSDSLSIINFIDESRPDYFINTACQSHVMVSYLQPEYTSDIAFTGVIRCLEALKKYSPHTRFLQCSTSEQFGSSPPPQNELTKFSPRSSYATAKVGAYYNTILYREAFKMFCANSISFNHESPRRPETFIGRKISRACTRIKLGLQDKLVLGSLEPKRDFTHAKDVAKGIMMILDHEVPDDFVIGSGEMRSIRDLVSLMFNKVDLDWQKYVVLDNKYKRPAEVDALCADNSKIKSILGWEPEYTFEQLVDEMIEYDMKLAQKELLLK